MKPTTYSLEVVLHLAQLGHDGDRLLLSRNLEDLGVLISLVSLESSLGTPLS